MEDKKFILFYFIYLKYEFIKLFFSHLPTQDRIYLKIIIFFIYDLFFIINIYGYLIYLRYFKCICFII